MPGYSAILAFGDSLTWGRNPADRSRHAEADRWPSVIQAGLGEGVRVVAEGLPGRTTMFDDHVGPLNKNGALHLPVVLSTHGPFDLVVVMLGTNDLKPAICGHAEGVVAGLARLVAIIRDCAGETVPDILLVSPPLLCNTAGGGGPGGGRSLAESEKLAPAIRELCAETGCHFLDAAPVARASTVDGVHLDAANTRAVGAAVLKFIREGTA